MEQLSSCHWEWLGEAWTSREPSVRRGACSCRWRSAGGPFKKLHVFATWCVNVESGWCCYVKTRRSEQDFTGGRESCRLLSPRLWRYCGTAKCVEGGVIYLFIWLFIWTLWGREGKKTQHDSTSAPFSSFAWGKRTPDASPPRQLELIYILFNFLKKTSTHLGCFSSPRGGKTEASNSYLEQNWKCRWGGLGWIVGSATDSRSTFFCGCLFLLHVCNWKLTFRALRGVCGVTRVQVAVSTAVSRAPGRLKAV